MKENIFIVSKICKRKYPERTLRIAVLYVKSNLNEVIDGWYQENNVWGLKIQKFCLEQDCP